MDAKSMDRESAGCHIVGFYCTLFFLVDVWRQVTGYGVKYINNNTYPIPQTAIVALTETFKFTVFFGLLFREGGIRSIKGSYLYIIPSLIYAVNNNVYYYALHFTTPPIWNIIIQLRIVFTALTYRVVFKRFMSIPKYVGIVLLLCAIVLTNTSVEEEHDDDQQKSDNLLVAFMLAGFGSITSAIGSIVMEVK
jgi:UDP-sugar transporter A1/2/3